ncbi:HNH endonuclease [Nocardioides sp. NPDC006303]|uniref:HNH endonuclease n=1 Tax=Nocardioides sp. NPDC006303 TaxID=3156747 RepID=UPI0033BD0062
MLTQFALGTVTRVHLRQGRCFFYARTVARTYGKEFPERPLMGVISDLMGIEHFTTSPGSTVRRDFLVAVGEGLGVSAETLQALPTKDDVLSAVVEAATRAPMDPGLLSPGATVTNEALQTIVDGIMKHGAEGRPDVPQVEGRPLADGDSLEFDLADLNDERDRRLMKIAANEGQDHFRSALLDAYGEQCAITGCEAVEALAATHIYPHAGPAANSVTNGLLLRLDVCQLYNRGAISVHETTHDVLVKPHLMVTQYADLAEQRLRVPESPVHHPSTAALRSHREWAGV